jgi:hypothetical protein
MLRHVFCYRSSPVPLLSENVVNAAAREVTNFGLGFVAAIASEIGVTKVREVGFLELTE